MQSNELRTITLRTIADLTVLHRLWAPEEIEMYELDSHRALVLTLPRQKGMSRAVQRWSEVLGLGRPELKTYSNGARDWQSISARRDWKTEGDTAKWLDWDVIEVRTSWDLK